MNSIVKSELCITHEVLVSPLQTLGGATTPGPGRASPFQSGWPDHMGVFRGGGRCIAMGGGPTPPGFTKCCGIGQERGKNVQISGSVPPPEIFPGNASASPIYATQTNVSKR